MKRKSITLLIAGAAGAFGILLAMPGEPIRSADHLDPPQRTSPSSDDTPDRAADIADVFAWAEGDNLNLILTFAGPVPQDQAATYDRDVLYTFNISTDGDPLNAEQRVMVRFGSAGSNNNGVRVEGIPGVGTLEGPVETTLGQNGVRVRAGLFDDPFFFDLQGFRDTLSTGDLQFDSSRDFFAEQNLTAVAVQIPLANFNATGTFAIWSETKRFGGQL